MFFSVELLSKRESGFGLLWYLFALFVIMERKSMIYLVAL